MNILKFSGHDTFHCRQQWLSKGVKIIENEGFTVFNKPEIAISKLGVGKNMVQSIQHWLKAFGLLNDKHEISELSKKMFINNNGFDPYLEDEGTLWLLQYKICNTNYASIFNLVFSEYFSDKVSLEFSENQILQFIDKKLRDNNVREISVNTLNSDYKVFVKSYATPTKSLKTIEDDFNSPLLELNLISQLSGRNSNGETIYRINKEVRNTIPVPIFGYCLLDYLEDRKDINHDEIRNTFGSYFCLSSDGLDNLIELLCFTYPEFIYKNDAGIRQIQIKGVTKDFKNNLLESYYGI
jgi:hypothetical protein